MGMSPGVCGPSDDAESIATLHAALEAGVTLLDTGDFYRMGHNEMLIRRALDGLPRSRVPGRVSATTAGRRRSKIFSPARSADWARSRCMFADYEWRKCQWSRFFASTVGQIKGLCDRHAALGRQWQCGQCGWRLSAGRPVPGLANGRRSAIKVLYNRPYCVNWLFCETL